MALVVVQSFVVAVVIPEKKEIQSFAKQQGISGDYSDFLKNDKVQPAVHDRPSITCYSGSINCTRASLYVLLNRTRKEKTTPFGINLMRSLVEYQAAQMFRSLHVPALHDSADVVVGHVQAQLCGTHCMV